MQTRIEASSACTEQKTTHAFDSQQGQCSTRTVPNETSPQPSPPPMDDLDVQVAEAAVDVDHHRKVSKAFDGVEDEEYDAQMQVIQQRAHKKKARMEEQFRLEAAL
jgi:hypothetical protein